jgi:dTDP-4-amino-4,6-dideoxygalactose transaminase
MAVPLVDLGAQHQSIRPQLDAALSRVLARADFILGEDVQRFEEAFAAYCGAKHCVSVASGTEALHLALRGLGIGPGDEVIVPANSFVASAFAVSHAGATPVFVDVDADDHCLDVRWLEGAITPRTRAILPVHLYGQPAPMEPILRVARRRGLQVVEDACQAHGAEYRGRRTGSLGAAACFSFYPTKNLGACGDGGAVVTDDSALAGRLALLRHYAQPRKNVHTEVGYNSRLDSVQAAILRVKLDHLDGWNEARRTLAARYAELLAGTDLLLPRGRSEVRPVYHLYVVRHPRRDALGAFLAARGIGTAVHYPVPLPHQAPYRGARSVPAGAPVASALAREVLSLPMYPELQEAQLVAVAEAVGAFAASPSTPGRGEPAAAPSVR